MNEARGIIYCATGQVCAHEFNISAESAKKSNPDIKIACFVDGECLSIIDNALADFVFVLEDPLFSVDDKIEAMERTPFHKTLFIDTDTLVWGDLEPLFDVLDYCSISAAHEPYISQFPWEMENYSNALPQWNTGVVAFRVERCVELFKLWRNKRLDSGNLGGDQIHFREAVIETGVDILTFRQEYNCRLGDPQRLVGPVVIAHHHSIPKRSPKGHESLRKKINFTSQSRAWLPKSEVLVRKKNENDLLALIPVGFLLLASKMMLPAKKVARVLISGVFNRRAGDD